MERKEEDGRLAGNAEEGGGERQLMGRRKREELIGREGGRGGREDGTERGRRRRKGNDTRGGRWIGRLRGG